jgi:hypothetical protein
MGCKAISSTLNITSKNISFRKGPKTLKYNEKLSQIT